MWLHSSLGYLIYDFVPSRNALSEVYGLDIHFQVKAGFSSPPFFFHSRYIEINPNPASKGQLMLYEANPNLGNLTTPILKNVTTSIRSTGSLKHLPQSLFRSGSIGFFFLPPQVLLGKLPSRRV